MRVFFQDEARVGQKGRVCRRWFTRGVRPPGRCDQRYTFAYVFAAAEVTTDNAFALIMPEVNTDMMQTFLDEFAKTIPETDHVGLEPTFAPPGAIRRRTGLIVPKNAVISMF